MITYAFDNDLDRSTYLFIDGGCFRQMLNDISVRYFEGNFIQFDYHRFAKSFKKVFYYDAIPAQGHDEPNDIYRERVRKEQEFFDKLGEIDSFHVYLGSMHKRKKRNEQKQVDIMIAIDMLTHAFRKNMSEATLLTTDSDFIPLIDAMVQNGMVINLWYPDTQSCRANKELIASADKKGKLGVQEIYAYCTSDFKGKYKIPNAILVHDGVCDNEIATWKDPTRGDVKLCKSKDVFYLIFFSGNNCVQVSFQNMNALRAYAMDIYKIAIPQIEFTL